MAFKFFALFLIFIAVLGCTTGSTDPATPDPTRPVDPALDPTNGGTQINPIQPASGFQLTSSAFLHNGRIPLKYTCDGGETSPPLTISGVPKGTVTFALIMEDPDIPTEFKAQLPGGIFDHWIVYNMPAAVTTIAEGQAPYGSLGVNTANEQSYIGPCPPTDLEPKEHRYFFKLYALDKALNLEKGATKAVVEASMLGHILEQTELVGVYQSGVSADSPTNPTDPSTGSTGDSVTGDQFPTITTSVSPTNPSSGDTFTLTITAEDDRGVQSLSWESSKDFSNYAKSNNVFSCNQEKMCTNSWDILTLEEGLYILTAFATDSAGQDSGKSLTQINVGPAAAPICGNNACEYLRGETNETCAQDCIPYPFVCGNAVCEGGESTINCSQDCDGTLTPYCGNNDCEPGDSYETCFPDCSALEPNCGNGVCDEWETLENCYTDCPVTPVTPDPTPTVDDNSCNSDSDCSGSKRKCKSGTCVTVQCTTSSQCSGCKRCSYNSCVSCGSGPYGCYC